MQTGLTSTFQADKIRTQQNKWPIFYKPKQILIKNEIIAFISLGFFISGHPS